MSLLNNVTPFPKEVDKLNERDRVNGGWIAKEIEAPIFETSDGIFCHGEGDAAMFFCEYDGEFREPSYINPKLKAWAEENFPGSHWDWENPGLLSLAIN